MYVRHDLLAIADLNRALTINPESTNTILVRAQAQTLMGNYYAAIDDCAHLIELDSNDVTAYAKRAFCFLYTKQTMAALVFFTKAINKNPQQTADVYFARGYCYHVTNAFQQALDDYNKAISLDPNYTDAYLNIGNCNYALRNFEKSFEAYAIAERLQPVNSTIYYARGFNYIETGEPNKAYIEWRKALALDNTYVQEYLDQYCGKK